MSHKAKTPPDWVGVTTADPGGRVATDATWVHRDLEYKSSLPQPNYSTGSGEGHNNGS